METLTLRPGKKKWVKMLLISSVFVIGGGWMIAQGTGPALASWAATLFFGLGILLAIAMLIPALNGLVLTAEGFTLKTFGRVHPRWNIKWRDLAAFTIFQIPVPSMGSAQELVGIHFTPAARAALPPARAAKMERQRQRYGCDGAMPNSYDMPIGELVALLNEWRTKHT